MTMIKPRVFFDMDGVLADFDGRMSELYGQDIHNRNRDGFVASMIDMVDNFGGFTSFDPLPGLRCAENLVRDFGSHVDFYICTSHGSFHSDPEKIGEQKRAWLDCQSRILNQLPFILVSSGEKKSLYVQSRHDILIDDTFKCIRAWNLAGGIGVHVPTIDSIPHGFKMVESMLHSHTLKQAS